MEQRLATFSPNDITSVISQVSTGISHIITGFSEDSIVAIDRNSDTYEMYVGADDSTTRIYKADTSGMFTFSLQQTSASNDVLSQLYEKDRVSRNSTGLFSIFIKDNSGRSYYFAEEAYIGVVPNSAFANSMQTREWVIHTPRLRQFIGGNAKMDADTVAVLEALGLTVDPAWIQ